MDFTGMTRTQRLALVAALCLLAACAPLPPAALFGGNLRAITTACARRNTAVSGAVVVVDGAGLLNCLSRYGVTVALEGEGE